MSVGVMEDYKLCVLLFIKKMIVHTHNKLIIVGLFAAE
jgi:hypothetical protein